MVVFAIITTISGIQYYILPQSFNCMKKYRVRVLILILRVRSITYHSVPVLNIMSDSITKETEKSRLSAKLVVTGFMMFAFFVLIAIGGTTAASYVISPPGPG